MKLVSILVCLIVAGLTVGQAWAADILGARIGVRTEGTRFVVDLSGKTDFKIDKKESDDRIVINLPKTKLDKGRKVPKWGNGLIKHSMIIAQGEEAAQIILFLKKPAKVNKVFRIAKTAKKPYRLVIDLVEK